LKIIARVASVLLTALTVSLPASAQNVPPPSLGGDEGEIDIGAGFTGRFGQLEPTERPTTFQPADIKTFSGHAGYTVGEFGPLHDFYLRVGGGYFTAAPEQVQDPADDLPLGYRFHEQDRGGYISATIAGNLVREPRYSFGVVLRGTAPLDVDLAKFSSEHLHLVTGGSRLEVFVTDPDKLFRITYSATMLVGSGTYLDGAQHNAQGMLTNLVSVQAAWWALPWRIGVRVGPHFEADLNEHLDAQYRAAYATVSPDLVAGDRIRAATVALLVQPFFQITEHAVVELGYAGRLTGYDAASTQMWTGSVEARF